MIEFILLIMCAVCFSEALFYDGDYSLAAGFLVCSVYFAWRVL